MYQHQYVLPSTHPVVCLCGSTKFKSEFEEVNHLFTMEGWIVLAPGVFAHSNETVLTHEAKVALDAMHKQKILMAELVFVVNPGGYIGESTRSEIEFALAWDKEVKYLFVQEEPIAKESTDPASNDQGTGTGLDIHADTTDHGSSAESI